MLEYIRNFTRSPYAILSALSAFLLLMSAGRLEAILPGKDEALIEVIKNAQLRLIVMRHGEAINTLQNFIDSNPSPGIYLTEAGEQQVLEGAQLLKGERIDAVYVSPMYRCLQTSHLVAKELGIPYDKIFVSQKLREQNFGFFNGLTYADFKLFFPDKQGMFLLPVPEGESGLEVFNRSRNLIWKVVLNYNNATVLIVTHALNCCQINRALTGAWGKFPQSGQCMIYNYQDL